MRSNVDFPQPDGPTTETKDPSFRLAEIDATASVPDSNVLEMRSREKNGPGRIGSHESLFSTAVRGVHPDTVTNEIEGIGTGKVEAG